MTIIAACGLGVTGGGLALPVASAQPTTADFSAQASAQVAALQRIKTTLTPVERKLDSHLVVELRKRQDAAALAATPRLSTGVAVSKAGTTLVTVRSTAVGASLIGRLRSVGGAIRYTSPTAGTVTVDAPLSAMTTIASWPDVSGVSLASGAMTARQRAPGAAPPPPPPPSPSRPGWPGWRPR